MRRGDVLTVALVAAGLALAVAGAFVLARDGSAARHYEELAEQVVRAGTEADNATGTSREAGDGNASRAIDWDALRELNGAACAWLEVEGTTVDVPVLAAPADDPDRWLSTDVWGNESETGAPYLDARCDADGRALMVYGHRTAYESYLFHDVSPLFEQRAFDGVGRATWHTPESDATTFSPLCAASVDEGDSRWMRTSFESADGLRAWLAWAVGESGATSGEAPRLVDAASRVLVLVTCNGRAFYPTTRTVAVFVT